MGEDDLQPMPEITPPATLAVWLAALATGKWSWIKNGRCKYVTLKIDTRRGACRIEDRDGKPISFEELAWQYSPAKPSPIAAQETIE